MTLIEVLVAVVLVSIAMIGLMGLLATVQKNNTASQDRNRVALLVNEMASAMWLNNSVNYTTGNLNTAYTAWKTKVGNPAQGGLVNATPSVALDATGTIATISISWTAPQKAESTATNDSSNTYSSVQSSDIYSTQVVLP